ncbi:hypothetical protein HUT19_03715 [Streptomyces sp. NA02950]|uniref:hypothetical protein n=1 Tax=Streptomyces sp. NA02950 TaxID=2742137 RepID=UPI00159298A6|nr:hypothetical protein [Streptomyces sp. NA02950]QKV90956.1 hypothetical protein HUT19_03715 [Streptomyces sp. NA02950]
MKTAARPGRAAPQRPRDYSGAVYGSLLAASVVAGTGTPGPYPRVQLVALLLITGLVFWAAHVYARLAGERLGEQPLNGREVRRVALHEWPIVQAAVPPAVAVAISPLLGLGLEGTAWFALAVAVAEQIGWASVAVRRAGASLRLTVVAGAGNLLLGLIIVAAKATLTH